MKSTFYHGKLYDIIKEMEVDGMNIDLNNEYVRNYLAFMYNEDNIHKNCWVKAYCQSKEEER